MANNKTLVRSNMGDLVDFDELSNKFFRDEAQKTKPRARRATTLEVKAPKAPQPPKINGFVAGAPKPKLVKQAVAEVKTPVASKKRSTAEKEPIEV